MSTLVEPLWKRLPETKDDPIHQRCLPAPYHAPENTPCTSRADSPRTEVQELETNLSKRQEAPDSSLSAFVWIEERKIEKGN